MKQILRKIVENTPVLADYYTYHRLFPRTVNSYRGIFTSFAEASQSVPQSMLAGYDHAYLHNGPVKGNSMGADITADIGQFKPIDYPVLVWLRAAFAEGSTIFDLGGSTGYSYYAYQQFIPYPDSLRWVICDVPEAVNVGNELLKRTHSPGLSYTTDFANAADADIFLTCGALQYIEPSLATLLRQLQPRLPRHIIVQHVPFYDGEDYITLQNLWGSYAPYKIQNYNQFVTSLESLDYEVVDHWRIDRTCSIPFHRDRFVDAYHGIYLRQRSPVNVNSQIMQ